MKLWFRSGLLPSKKTKNLVGSWQDAGIRYVGWSASIYDSDMSEKKCMVNNDASKPFTIIIN